MRKGESPRRALPLTLTKQIQAGRRRLERSKTTRLVKREARRQAKRAATMAPVPPPLPPRPNTSSTPQTPPPPIPERNLAARGPPSHSPTHSAWSDSALRGRISFAIEVGRARHLLAAHTVGRADKTRGGRRQTSDPFIVCVPRRQQQRHEGVYQRQSRRPRSAGARGSSTSASVAATAAASPLAGGRDSLLDGVRAISERLSSTSASLGGSRDSASSVARSSGGFGSASSFCHLSSGDRGSRGGSSGSSSTPSARSNMNGSRTGSGYGTGDLRERTFTVASSTDPVWCSAPTADVLDTAQHSNRLTCTDGSGNDLHNGQRSHAHANGAFAPDDVLDLFVIDARTTASKRDLFHRESADLTNALKHQFQNSSRGVLGGGSDDGSELRLQSSPRNPLQVGGGTSSGDLSRRRSASREDVFVGRGASGRVEAPLGRCTVRISDFFESRALAQSVQREQRSGAATDNGYDNSVGVGVSEASAEASYVAAGELLSAIEIALRSEAKLASEKDARLAAEREALRGMLGTEAGRAAARGGKSSRASDDNRAPSFSASSPLSLSLRARVASVGEAAELDALAALSIDSGTAASSSSASNASSPAVTEHECVGSAEGSSLSDSISSARTIATAAATASREPPQCEWRSHWLVFKLDESRAWSLLSAKKTKSNAEFRRLHNITEGGTITLRLIVCVRPPDQSVGGLPQQHGSRFAREERRRSQTALCARSLSASLLRTVEVGEPMGEEGKATEETMRNRLRPEVMRESSSETSTTKTTGGENPSEGVGTRARAGAKGNRESFLRSFLDDEEEWSRGREASVPSSPSRGSSDCIQQATRFGDVCVASGGVGLVASFASKDERTPRSRRDKKSEAKHEQMCEEKNTETALAARSSGPAAVNTILNTTDAATAVERALWEHEYALGWPAFFTELDRVYERRVASRLVFLNECLADGGGSTCVWGSAVRAAAARAMNSRLEDRIGESKLVQNDAALEELHWREAYAINSMSSSRSDDAAMGGAVVGVKTAANATWSSLLESEQSLAAEESSKNATRHAVRRAKTSPTVSMRTQTQTHRTPSPMRRKSALRESARKHQELRSPGPRPPGAAPHTFTTFTPRSKSSLRSNELIVDDNASRAAQGGALRGHPADGVSAATALGRSAIARAFGALFECAIDGRVHRDGAVDPMLAVLPPRSLVARAAAAGALYSNARWAGYDRAADATTSTGDGGGSFEAAMKTRVAKLLAEADATAAALAAASAVARAAAEQREAAQSSAVTAAAAAANAAAAAASAAAPAAQRVLEETGANTLTERARRDSVSVAVSKTKLILAAPAAAGSLATDTSPAGTMSTQSAPTLLPLPPPLPVMNVVFGAEEMEWRRKAEAVADADAERALREREEKETDEKQRRKHKTKWKRHAALDTSWGKSSSGSTSCSFESKLTTAERAEKTAIELAEKKMTPMMSLDAVLNNARAALEATRGLLSTPAVVSRNSNAEHISVEEETPSGTTSNDAGGRTEPEKVDALKLHASASRLLLVGVSPADAVDANSFPPVGGTSSTAVMSDDAVEIDGDVSTCDEEGKVNRLQEGGTLTTANVQQLDLTSTALDPTSADRTLDLSTTPESDEKVVIDTVELDVFREGGGTTTTAADLQLDDLTLYRSLEDYSGEEASVSAESSSLDFTLDDESLTLLPPFLPWREGEFEITKANAEDFLPLVGDRFGMDNASDVSIDSEEEGLRVLEAEVSAFARMVADGVAGTAATATEREEVDGEDKETEAKAEAETEEVTAEEHAAADAESDSMITDLLLEHAAVSEGGAGSPTAPLSCHSDSGSVVRSPSSAENAAWVGESTKRELIAFLYACGTNAALSAAKLSLAREPVTKNKLKKLKLTALRAAALAVLLHGVAV